MFRRELLKRGDLIYAICNFHFPILLDEETCGPNPRLSIAGSNVGYEFPPFENIHGHVDYDPFKYDVGLLGIWFSDTFYVLFNSFFVLDIYSLCFSAYH